jgi:hypothetical protein
MNEEVAALRAKCVRWGRGVIVGLTARTIPQRRRTRTAGVRSLLERAGCSMIPRMRLLVVSSLLLAACDHASSSGERAADAARPVIDAPRPVDAAGDERPRDATTASDATTPRDAPRSIDAGEDAADAATLGDGGDASLAGDAAVYDASSLPVAEWTLYTIIPGVHSATMQAGPAGRPYAGFAGPFAGRDYFFVFDSSAIYTITMPVQPDDQLDWNKLPGLSDCGQSDLSVEGVMFGWRWRLDTTPNVLEVTAYANDSSMHLTPTTVLFTLDADDLASETPLHYRFWIQGSTYQFAVTGAIRGRAIDATASLPRTCGDASPGALTEQWAAGFYFGGTSTAPSTITGRVFELPFEP